jgi:hypothetical protein
MGSVIGASIDAEYGRKKDSVALVVVPAISDWSGGTLDGGRQAGVAVVLLRGEMGDVGVPGDADGDGEGGRWGVVLGARRGG